MQFFSYEIDHISKHFRKQQPGKHAQHHCRHSKAPYRPAVLPVQHPENQETAEADESTASADIQSQSESSGDPSTQESASAPAASNEAISIPESYTVRKGDTLLKISRQVYGRDDEIDAICSLNGIEDSDRILEGQKLLLP